VPYVAVTSAAYPADVYDKVRKARDIKGPALRAHEHALPERLGFDPKDSVALGKLAVDTGLVVLYEVEAAPSDSRAAARRSLEAASASRSPTTSRRKPLPRLTPRPPRRSRRGSTERWAGTLARDAGTTCA